MKKYWWLIGITVTLSAALLLVSGVWKRRLPVVEVTVLKEQTVEQTVRCTGKIEEAGGKTQAAAASGNKVQVRVAVPESRLKQVAVGQRARITGAAFGEDYYTGTVVSLGKSAYTAPSGGTVVDAVIALDATDPSLRCGLTAKAGICVERVENGLVVPYACLQEEEDGDAYVYVLRDARAVRCAVTVGEELADGALVTEGVAAGDVLITNPDDVPADGVRVTRGEANG